MVLEKFIGFRKSLEIFGPKKSKIAEFHYRYLGVVQNWLTWEFRGKMANLAKNRDFARMNGYEATLSIDTAANWFWKSLWASEKVLKFLIPKNQKWQYFITVFWMWSKTGSRGNLGGKWLIWQKLRLCQNEWL